jgi:serine/threonine protein kinase
MGSIKKTTSTSDVQAPDKTSETMSGTLLQRSRSGSVSEGSQETMSSTKALLKQTDQKIENDRGKLNNSTADKGKVSSNIVQDLIPQDYDLNNLPKVPDTPTNVTNDVSSTPRKISRLPSTMDIHEVNEVHEAEEDEQDNKPTAPKKISNLHEVNDAPAPTKISNLPEIKDKKLDEKIKKISHETGRTRLDKLEGLKEKYGLNDTQIEKLNTKIESMKVSKLQTVDKEGKLDIHANLDTFVNNFKKVTDPGMTIHKSKILPLHNALDQLAAAPPSEKLALLDAVKTEIANYKQLRGNDSSKMNWVNELEKQINQSKPAFEVDHIQNKINTLIGKIEEKGDKEGKIHFEHTRSIEKIIDQINILKANGNNNPALDAMKSSLQETRTIFAEKLNTVEKNKLELTETVDLVLTQIDLSDQNTITSKTKDFLKANIGINDSGFWQSNFVEKPIEAISERIQQKNPNLSKPEAEEIAGKILDGMISHFNTTVGTKSEILEVNVNTEQGNKPGVNKLKIGDETYEFSKKLAVGGAGRIFEFTSDTGKKLVLKEFFLPEKASEELRPHINVLKNGTHENFVDLKDVFLDPKGTCYSVLPFASGGDALGIESSLFGVKSMNLYPEKEIDKVLQMTFKDMAKGLEFVHQQGYISRDVKPENFLFDKSTGTFMMSDLGEATHETTGIEKKGTNCYMAPEMVFDRGYDNKSDVWSLGITLHLLAHNQLPFGLGPGDMSENVKESFERAQKRGETALPQDSDKPLDKLINKMLSFNPNERPSITEVLNHEFFTQDLGSMDNAKGILKSLPDIAKLEKDARAEVDRRTKLPHDDPDNLRRITSQAQFDQEVVVVFQTLLQNQNAT